MKTERITKESVIETGAALSAEPLPLLRKRYHTAMKASGIPDRSFRNEIMTLRNVLDGRCPDGCCGNEDAAPWTLTPGEWTCLAMYLSPLLKANPKRYGY